MGAQTSVSQYRNVAQNAAPFGLYSNEYFDTVVNSLSQTAQIGTIVVDTATNDATYTWTINGEVLTYVADGSTSKIEIAAGIVAAINDHPLVRMAVSAVSDGVDTVTLTAVVAGVGFTASDSDAKLTTTQAATASAEATAVPFGRFVRISGTSGLEKIGGMPLVSALTAKVYTIAITYAASEIYSVAITYAGQTYEVNVLATVDSATTGAAIVTAINAMMPAATVIASGTSTVTLTDEKPGQGFTVSVGLVTGTTARAVLTNTVAGTVLEEVFGGVSTYAYDEEDGSANEYPANAGVRTQVKGEVWVTSTETPAFGADVYVETVAGATNGRFYATTSSTRVKLPKSVAKWVAYDATAGLGRLSINAPLAA